MNFSTIVRFSLQKKCTLSLHLPVTIAVGKYLATSLRAALI